MLCGNCETCKRGEGHGIPKYVSFGAPSCTEPFAPTCSDLQDACS